MPNLFTHLAKRFIVPCTAKRAEGAAIDIETDGLLGTVTKVHCIVIGDLERDEIAAYGPDQIPAALAHLARVDYLVGHNITGFDLPALKLLHRWAPALGCTILDTLVCSRLILPNLGEIDKEVKARGGSPQLGKLTGKHSLEAWGPRLDVPKVGADITDWSQWAPEMQERCVGDVRLTKALYHFLQPEGYSQTALALEHRAALICNRITQDGAPFDRVAAAQLHEQWTTQLAEREAQLSQQFPGTNLNSRPQIGALLEKRGWVPEARTEKTGQPKVSDELLETIPTTFPEFAGLAEYAILKRRIAQLSTGKQALRKHGDDGLIHGGLIHIGTPHSRAKHLSPNLAQVPNAKKGRPFATEFRALFRPGNGFVVATADQAGLQDRTFANCLTEFDAGTYAKTYTENIGRDTHWGTAGDLGLIAEGETRDKTNKVHEAIREGGAKTFRFAFLFGAGAERAGQIISNVVRTVANIDPVNDLQQRFFGGAMQPSKAALQRVGKRALRKFIAATPGLAQLRASLTTQVDRYGWLPGLDGRRVPVRAQYTALNYAVTSAEAIICKTWLVNVYDELCARFRYGWDGDVVIVLWIHDEVACCCRPEIADQVGEILVRHAKTAGEPYAFRVPLDAEYKIGRSWAGEPTGEAPKVTTTPIEIETPAPKSKPPGDALDQTLDYDGDDDGTDEDAVQDFDAGIAQGGVEFVAGAIAAPDPQQDRLQQTFRSFFQDDGPTTPGPQPRTNGAYKGNGHAGPTGNGPDQDDEEEEEGHSGGYPHGVQRGGQYVAVYIYQDHVGRNHTKVRKKAPRGSGRAQYPQSFWVGGKWVPKKPAGWRKVPYKLPEMLTALAAAPDVEVYVPEGEKDCESVRALGLIATTSSEGATPLKAKASKWTPELNKWFDGVRRVYILEDNDAPGRKFAREKAQALAGIVPDVRIVSFPDVPDGEDVTWWLKDGGHTKDELLERCKIAPSWQRAGALDSVCASEVDMSAIDWLWRNRFAVGKIGIIAGLPDEGKGHILCYVAARVTKGGEWPMSEGASPRGGVLILSAEEDPSTNLVPRLVAAGADLKRVHFIKMVRDRDEKSGQERDRMFSLVTDLPKLRHLITEVGNVKALFIDPVSAYLGVGQVDSYRDTDVRAVLGPLKELAEELKVAIIAVMHFNKKVDITNALLRVSNSMAFVGLARHAYGVIADPENDRKLFVRAKNNDAADSDNQTLAFHFEVREVGYDAALDKAIRAPFIVWEPGYVDVTATEAMQAAAESKSPGDRDRAKQFVLGMLAGGLEVPAKEIKEAGEANGLAWSTIRRAKDDLIKEGRRITVDKDRRKPDGKWFWRLDGEGEPEVKN